MGSTASSAVAGAGLAATTTAEIGSTSIEGGAGLGAIFESTSATIADGSAAIEGALSSGAEDVLLGDATTDAIAGATGDTMAGIGEVADTLVVAAGDAGAGVLSMLPGWLVSGGLAALASEVAFGIFAIFVLLKAGGSAANEVVAASTDAMSKSNKESDIDQSTDAALRAASEAADVADSMLKSTESVEASADTVLESNDML